MNKQKILIIEEEVIIAVNIQNELEKKGYDVCDIGISANEAVSLTEKHNPDLILIDIILDGEKDGITPVEEIKKKHDIPIVYITAHSDDKQLQRAKKTGPNGYLIKPIKQEELLSTIEIALYKHIMEEKLKKSEDRYGNLFRNVPIGLYRSEIGTSKFLAVNEKLAEIFEASVDEIMKEPAIVRWANPEEREKMIKIITDMGHISDYELDILTKNGREKTILTTMKLHPDEGYIEGAVIDITKRKNADNKIKQKNEELEDSNKELQSTMEELEAMNEELEAMNEEQQATMEELGATQYELEESEKHYRTLFTEMLDGYALHEIICNEHGEPVDYRFIDINPSFEKLTGLSRDLVGKTALESLPEIEKYWIDTYGEVALTGKPKLFENYSKELGKWFEVTAFRPAENQFACIFKDITGTKLTEKALKQSEERFKYLSDASFEAILIHKDGVLLSANDQYYQMFGYESDELTGKQIIPITIAAEFIGLINKQIKSGALETYEAVGLKKDGSMFDMEIHVREARYMGVNARIGVIRDITERKKTEELIKNSLKEKETLLKEIHHRVKNNMQVITSLLALQADQVKDEEARESFHICENRIKSMALVHEQLYQTNNLSAINFEEYLEQLIKDIFSSNNIFQKKIKSLINVKDICLDLDRAIPCGLIITELVSNIIKHAFPGNKKGKLWIDLIKNKNNRYSLTVEDNGTGFPENMDINNTDSLGFTLINALVQQLKGKMEISGKDGTKISITFPE